MQPYQIILLILITAAFVVSLCVIFVLTHIYKFGSSMKKRLKAMDILLSEKASDLLYLIEALQKDDIELSKDDIEFSKRLGELHFDKPSSIIVSENKNKIEAVRKRISYLAVVNSSISSHPAYKECMSLLEDLDRAFRRCVVLYNSDLNGYNYWIDIPGIRPFIYLFRVEKAKPIN
ncbi:MAG: hypothetical protein K6B65_02680 [Bacilli bacterium]|nr:hypothetical protein [Bacilli bacterium]